MTTRAILFDFYGTLARATAWGPTLADVLAEHSLALDPEARSRWRDEAIDGVDHVEHSVDRRTYVAWERARLGRLATACGAADPEPVVEALYRALKNFTLEAYEEVPDVLGGLRADGHTVAVCSNWDWDLGRAMARSGLALEEFDVIVTSAQAGARKPHPRIYEYTLERCGVAAEEALFVGDTWGPDVEGPTSMGMRAALVWREGERDGQEPPPAAQCIPDLRGLGDLL